VVTILPIDVEEDIVREGLTLAIAERVRRALKELDQQAAELAAAAIVDREKWDAAFDALATVRESMTPVLEYARAFADQWPEDDDNAATA
jgi:hypothetical protein